VGRWQVDNGPGRNENVFYFAVMAVDVSRVNAERLDLLNRIRMRRTIRVG
jgi:hypothetical protein